VELFDRRQHTAHNIRKGIVWAVTLSVDGTASAESSPLSTADLSVHCASQKKLQ